MWALVALAEYNSPPVSGVLHRCSLAVGIWCNAKTVYCLSFQDCPAACHLDSSIWLFWGQKLWLFGEIYKWPSLYADAIFELYYRVFASFYTSYIPPGVIHGTFRLDEASFSGTYFFMMVFMKFWKFEQFCSTDLSVSSCRNVCW